MEWKQKFWPPKNRENTQIKNRDPVFGAIAGVTLTRLKRFIP
jgi:hypothetical protein